MFTFLLDPRIIPNIYVCTLDHVSINQSEAMGCVPSAARMHFPKVESIQMQAFWLSE